VKSCATSQGQKRNTPGIPTEGKTDTGCYQHRRDITNMSFFAVYLHNKFFPLRTEIPVNPTEGKTFTVTITYGQRNTREIGVYLDASALSYVNFKRIHKNSVHGVFLGGHRVS
jgi:hypothetical protein